MPPAARPEIDNKLPPFDHLTGIRRLAQDRSGKDAHHHGRHLLYAAHDRRTAANVLIKVTSKPGVVYQYNLANEIASLTAINRELPHSRHFPLVLAHGDLRDGRAYVITTLFDEFPLATSIDDERRPDRTVAHLRTAIAVAATLAQLHRLPIFHVDLNPMNILHRVERGRPVVRIVDFESSYEPARHSTGVFYDPPTTPGFSAPEVAAGTPDARADVFSLGAVLYTLLAGYGWTWAGEVGAAVASDRALDGGLRQILLTAVNPAPDSRFPSIDAFRAALAAYLEGIWPGRTW